MPYMMSDNGLCIHRQNSDGTRGDVVKCHKTPEEATAHMRALYANVEDAATKAYTGRLGDLLVAKIHQAFTVAADQLAQRGYLLQDQRIALSGVIGDLLGQFNKMIDPAIADYPVDGEDMGEIAEKETGPAGDYLVVEDREQPSTYHLRVKKDGAPDHTLMGAAWAALHGGYRGNKYEGPGKQEAIAKLRRLYEAEGMPVPSEKEVTGIMPEGVTMGEMIQIAELTADETQAIDRLYRDVVSGKVKLESLAEPEMATGKASVSYGSRSGGGPAGNPSGTPGGSQSDHSSKAERCYMRVKKLGADDATARKVCHSMFGGRPGIKQARSGASFTVYKQANGQYRWLAVTSSSFQDRDKEIVSQKALEADAERMNTSGDYGTLDWWHTPITLGACDFSAMHGRLSVESGTFRDAWTATKLAEAKGGFEMSRAFYHPITEPDPQGVYHNIKTFSRAIIPRGIGKASNLLTTFAVVEKEKQMLTDKIKELKSLFGGNKEASDRVDALLAEAEQKEKAAADAGIAAKEQKTEAVPETPAAKETPIADQPGMFVADMKPEEFDAHIATAINAAVKPLMDQLNALKEANAVAVKESSASVLAAALVEIKKLQDAQAETAKQVKELNGLTPRGYRATQDPATATTKDAKGPGADEKKSYFEQFVSGFVLGQPQPPVK